MIIGRTTGAAGAAEGVGATRVGMDVGLTIGPPERLMAGLRSSARGDSLCDLPRLARIMGDLVRTL